MGRIVKICAVVFCITACVGAYALADDASMARCGRMCMHEKMWEKMDAGDMAIMKAHFILANADELGLSADQAAKVKALKYSAKKSMVKSDADIEALALDIKEALEKDDADMAMINGLIDKKYAAKAQKTKEMVAACMNIKNVLTKDQQKKMKEIWSKGMTEKHEMMEGMEEGHHMMKGMGMHHKE